MQDEQLKPDPLTCLASVWCGALAPRLVMALVVSIAGIVAHSPLRAADNSKQVEIRADGAPLARTLVELVGSDGIDVRVDESIDDLLSGRLVGTADDLVDLLVDTHRLDMHREGKTVWFDRRGRPVVDFVRLDQPEMLDALRALASPVMPGGSVVVEADNRGLVLTGTRAYVESSLSRIALATGQLVPDFTVAGSSSTASQASDATQALIAASDSAEQDSEGTEPFMPYAAMPVLMGLPVDETRGHSLGSRRSGVALPMPTDAATARAPVLALDAPRTRDILGARIVLVSSLAPQAVILEDGSKVAPGGALPNGHRIVSIERNRIILVRDNAPIIVAMP